MIKQHNVKKIFAIMTVILAPIIFVVVDSTASKKEFTIAAGQKGSAYYQCALDYKSNLVKYDVILNLVETTGSMQTQRLLSENQVDFGIIQGGTEVRNEGIRSLANIAASAVWIFHSSSNSLKLKDLGGMKVSVSPQKLASNMIATKILKSEGIYESIDMQYDLPKDGEVRLLNGEVDALIMVAGEKSKIVRRLLKTEGIKVIPFKDIDKYKAYFLKDGDLFGSVNIPAGSLDLKNNYPVQSMNLLTKSTILASSKEVGDAAVRAILLTAKEIHSKDSMFSNSKAYPNDKSLVQSQHKSAKTFFEKGRTLMEDNFDFWLAQSMGKLHSLGMIYALPIISIIGFLFGVLFPTMLFFSRKKIVRWFSTINDIDTNIIGISREDGLIKLEKLKSIQKEVRNAEGINPTHMDEFYSLQSHIMNLRQEIMQEIER
jgi:TRAP-type uncharacterized transport system substrate-binding protein